MKVRLSLACFSPKQDLEEKKVLLVPYLYLAQIKFLDTILFLLIIIHFSTTEVGSHIY